ncbi:hypothetical protein MBOU_50500 [Mycobacterium bourgelatii]|uniref:Uncharacterized protein n=1 Tax=Mycobacterium bourgelatii TaxID=1273442 RepID=A0A7I9YWK5_MYCBU|nr:hypothetical protein MBOU_50500 [Mycobacterium bourgelatii]
MVLRNIIGRLALERGWDLNSSSSVMQQYSKGDTTIKVRYLHNGAIWHAEWFRGGTRRDVSAQDPHKRDVVISWLEE